MFTAGRWVGESFAEGLSKIKHPLSEKQRGD
jgi:hypothetical protein